MTSWIRRVDPYLPLVAVVALVTYLLHGFDGYLSRDLAIYAYAGQQVADGVPPYVGILNRAGPLAHWLPALGVLAARAGGFDELLGIRAVFMVFATGAVVVTYLLGRDLLRSRNAGLAAAAAMLTFTGFLHLATNGPREKTPMVLLIVLAMWAATHRRWFAAGVCVALATLILQIAFFVALPMVLAALAIADKGRRLRGLLLVLAGGFLPAAAALAYFALVGAFSDFIDAFLLINVRYTTPNPLMEALPRVWPRLWKGYHLSVWVLLVGLAATLVLPLLALRPSARPWDERRRLLAACGLATVVGLIWTLRDFDSWPDFFPLLPFAAVGFAALLQALSQRLPRPVAISTMLVWAVAATAFAVHWSVTERDRTLDLQRGSVQAVLSVLDEPPTMLSIQAPQPLVLTGTTNLSRHQMFTSGLREYVRDTFPGGVDGYRAWVMEQQPTLVSIGDPGREAWGSWLRPEYRRIGCSVGWTFFADADLGKETLHDLRAVSLDDCQGLEPR